MKLYLEHEGALHIVVEDVEDYDLRKRPAAWSLAADVHIAVKTLLNSKPAKAVPADMAAPAEHSEKLGKVRLGDEPMNEQIGWLLDGAKVIGLCCAPSPRNLCRIYRANIGGYRQTCCECGKVLVEGRTPAWPVLFDGKLAV